MKNDILNKAINEYLNIEQAQLTFNLNEFLRIFSQQTKSSSC